MKTKEQALICRPGMNECGTLENTAFAKLFTPLRVRGIELKNRIVMPACGVFGISDGEISDKLKDFLLARARGGTALIMVFASLFSMLEICPEHSLLERWLEILGDLVNSVHGHQALIGIQLHHGGRQPDVPIPGAAVVGPSPVPSRTVKIVPRELTIPEIEELIERYVERALLAKQVGFDVIEVKCCHGYLLNNFLSPDANRRTDEYGGDLVGRARFATKVIRGIREKGGNDIVICCRINGSDYVSGGFTLEEAKALTPLLEEAGVDIISVSAGTFGSYPTTIPTYYFRQGCFADLAAEIKSVAKVPILAVGRILDPLMGEELLLAGKADLIGMVRALIAAPDLPNKALHGQLDDIAKCIGCNQGCVDIEQAGGDIACLINPEVGHEKELTIVPAAMRKRVMVVGAGPAGLEAARVAALRGHEVNLFEEDDEVGGQWLLAAAPPHKQELMEVVRYLSGQLGKIEVAVHLGKVVTASLVEKLKPDVLIIASGAKPLIPPIPGANLDIVVTAWDVLAGHAQVGDRVLVVGGNSTGLETANFLADRGRKVRVVEMLEHFGTDLGRTLRYYLRHELDKNKVELFNRSVVEEISKEMVLVSIEGRRQIWRDFETVVLATGVVARNELATELVDKSSEIYVIGDAAQPRNCLYAIREGSEVGRRI